MIRAMLKAIAEHIKLQTLDKHGEFLRFH